VLYGVLSVHLLRSSASGLSAFESSLADYLSEQMILKSGRTPNPAEQRSWSRSIPALRADLMDAGLGDVEVLLEYQLPLTSKRADVVLAGRHPQTGNPSYVIVELKQWSSAEQFEDSDTLVRIEQYGDRAVTHPLEQVRGYCDYVTDFIVSLADQPHELAGAAYLHNATDLGVADLFDMAPPDASLTSRMFTGQRRGDFIDFLLTRLQPGAQGIDAADLLLGSKIAPSKQLLAVAADEVQ